MSESKMDLLRFADSGGRLTAREAARLAGLVVREPRTGWCILTDAGRAAREASP